MSRIAAGSRVLARMLAALVAILLLAGAATAAVVLGSNPRPAAVDVPVFGVLQADPHWLASDTAAGIRLAMLNVGWNVWEPAPGRFDSGYASQVASEVADYRKAGWQVAIDIGLQAPPPWVLSLPGGALVDQYGNRSDTPDFEFSDRVRRAADAYISQVVQTVGPVQYFRVGLGDGGEALYPGVTSNGFWAYDAAAQGSAPGLPGGVGATPLPGWVPGSSSWNGVPVTQAQVADWYNWYFGAMVGALAWEISAYRSAGYAGQLQLVVPGTGATPDVYEYRLAHDLRPAPDMDTYKTVNTAAVWWRVLDDLPDLTGIVVDISSVDDPSGAPPANVCQASDQSVDFLTDPQVDGWSDTRWLTYLARRHGLAVMGENPGDTPASALPQIMGLVRSCGLIALQWAFEPQLHQAGLDSSNAPYVSIGQYGAAIAAYRAGQRRVQTVPV